MNSIICGDCLEVLKRIPDNSADFIMTSPPYTDQIKNYGESIRKISQMNM